MEFWLIAMQSAAAFAVLAVLAARGWWSRDAALTSYLVWFLVANAALVLAAYAGWRARGYVWAWAGCAGVTLGLVAWIVKREVPASMLLLLWLAGGLLTVFLERVAAPMPWHFRLYGWAGVQLAIAAVAVWAAGRGQMEAFQSAKLDGLAMFWMGHGGMLLVAWWHASEAYRARAAGGALPPPSAVPQHALGLLGAAALLYLALGMWGANMEGAPERFTAEGAEVRP
jgi:hypothetical protein